MPPHVSADRSAAEPPERDTVDDLISQARRLRGGVDAVRREADAGGDGPDDPQARWQRAVCELAVHQLDDLGRQLGQLREGAPPAGTARPDEEPAAAPPPAHAAPPERADTGRAGSAEWNFLTDEVVWSRELFAVFGRSPEDGPLSLDELPSWLPEEDQPALTAMLTDCLVDGKPIDGEFRVVRADGDIRTLHMTGQPVLDEHGCTATMWAVLREVGAARDRAPAAGGTGDGPAGRQQAERTAHRLAAEFQEAVLPAWRGPLRFPQAADSSLDLAAHHLPSATGALVGGDWYDALRLPGGRTLLSTGDLTGHGVVAASGMAMLLGALRGMALAGVEPGPLMDRLNELLDASAQPALGSAVCCRYDPPSRTLAWSQAGHPAPLLFRDGTGRALTPPPGVLLGATSEAVYGQAAERLLPGDLLLLHTDGLMRHTANAGDRGRELLALAPRFAGARDAQECVRILVEEFGGARREDDACVLVARVTG
ncbi:MULTISPECIES: PP2C family protein-serine/threonine phosphatase [unclassified Streptomyces]|uniref:PP2C family protein-serine/threonine phosphatase n=1 Tax=unclassified Streptomyces TaxID=2593676 RepID=UPI000BF86D85|nr:SpoIIE family protein phosphatase [Streptomyces sp. Ru87]PGH51611.1 phosphatase [Streptomyces sp. Ru87]